MTTMMMLETSMMMSTMTKTWVQFNDIPYNTLDNTNLLEYTERGKHTIS